MLYFFFFQGWELKEPVQYKFKEFPYYETRKNEALFREYVKACEQVTRDRTWDLAWQWLGIEDPRPRRFRGATKKQFSSLLGSSPSAGALRRRRCGCLLFVSRAASGGGEWAGRGARAGR